MKLDMPEIPVDNKVSQETQAEDLESLQRRIATSFCLKENLPEAKPETREKICRLVSETVFDLQPLTGVSLENLVFVVQDDSKDEKCGSYYAPNKKRDGGILGFGRTTLQQYVEWVEMPILETVNYAGGVKYHLARDDQFRFRTAHEMFHVREAKRYPERWDRTTSVSADRKSRGHDWEQNRAELAAELFGLQYIKERATKGVLETLGKLLHALDASSQIKKMKKSRLAKGY